MWTAFDADTSRLFGLVVGLELLLAAGGMAVLAIRRHYELSSAWSRSPSGCTCSR
ncbi:MAG TPA: hypothetical protein VE645_08855 [Pseudonocardiaceae bacterium]|nr:hypothetical protein [Pseudonocardiaceae bacterium]